MDFDVHFLNKKGPHNRNNSIKVSKFECHFKVHLRCNDSNPWRQTTFYKVYTNNYSRAGGRVFPRIGTVFKFGLDIIGWR